MWEFIYFFDYIVSVPFVVKLNEGLKDLRKLEDSTKL